jgi:hypothetical protein
MKGFTSHEKTDFIQAAWLLEIKCPVQNSGFQVSVQRERLDQSSEPAHANAKANAIITSTCKIDKAEIPTPVRLRRVRSRC